MSLDTNIQKFKAPEVTAEFVDFLLEHSPIGQPSIEDYFDDKIEQIQSGLATWVLHEAYPDDGLQFDFYKGTKLLGYVVVDSEFKATAYMYNQSNRPANLFRSKSSKPDQRLLSALQKIEELSLTK